MFYVYDVDHDKILTVKATKSPAIMFMCHFIKRCEKQLRDLPGLVVVDTADDAARWAAVARAAGNVEDYAVALYAGGETKTAAISACQCFGKDMTDRGRHALYRLAPRVNGVSTSPRAAAIRKLMEWKRENP